MRQPPSSPRVNCTNWAPSCSSTTHLRYFVGQRAVGSVPFRSPPSQALLPHSHLCCLITSCPQACKNNICLDLSPGHGLDGRLTGHRVETWDVKVGAQAWVCPRHHALGRLERTLPPRNRAPRGTLGASSGLPHPLTPVPCRQDVVNCVGGMGALMPLLEQVAAQPLEAEAGPAETHDLVGPELTSDHNTLGLLLPLGKSSGQSVPLGPGAGLG